MDYEQVSALQGLTAQLHAVVGREVWHYSRTVIGRLGLGEGTKKGGGVLRIAWGTLSTCTFSIPTWINWPEFPELMGDRCIVKANHKILVNSFWEQKKSRLWPTSNITMKTETSCSRWFLFPSFSRFHYHIHLWSQFSEVRGQGHHIHFLCLFNVFSGQFQKSGHLLPGGGSGVEKPLALSLLLRRLAYILWVFHLYTPNIWSCP